LDRPGAAHCFATLYFCCFEMPFLWNPQVPPGATLSPPTVIVVQPV
jgi:hypothetical protein